MVAMFRYSSVATYTVSMPPHKLKFGGAIKQEWLMEETDKVCFLFIHFHVDIFRSVQADMHIIIFLTHAIMFEGAHERHKTVHRNCKLFEDSKL